MTDAEILVGIRDVARRHLKGELAKATLAHCRRALAPRAPGQ